MSEFMNIFSQFIAAIVQLGGIAVFAYIVYIILDEFARDAIKGKLKSKDYLSVFVGIGMVCLILAFGIAAVFFAIFEGWKRSQPYIISIQNEVIETVNTAFDGNASSSSINYNDTTTVINVNGIPPQAPTVQDVQGQDADVGGGVGIYPTALPAQGTALPAPTQVPVLQPTATVSNAPPLP